MDACAREGTVISEFSLLQWQVPAILGTLMAALSVMRHTLVSGWYLLVGCTYVFYISVIFFIELFIPGLHRHKLAVSNLVSIYQSKLDKLTPLPSRMA